MNARRHSGYRLFGRRHRVLTAVPFMAIYRFRAKALKCGTLRILNGPEVNHAAGSCLGTSERWSMAPVTYFVRMVAKPGQAEKVLELLLTNPHRIEAGEPGNIVFGVHRGIENPGEFWLYETWAGEDAVNAHESGDAFRRYKEELRPLVEPDSVLFGNTTPIKVLGYQISKSVK